MIKIKRLPKFKKRKNVLYNQVERSAMAAIYSQAYPANPDFIIGYEVIKIKKVELTGEKLDRYRQLIHQPDYPPTIYEAFPGDKQSGTFCWTYSSLQMAQTKFSELS